MKKTKYGITLLLAFFCCIQVFGQLCIYLSAEAEPVSLLIARMKLDRTKQGLELLTDLTKAKLPDMIVVPDGVIPAVLRQDVSSADMEGIKPEGYVLKWIRKKVLVVLAKDAVGAQYGLAEIRDALLAGGDLLAITEKRCNPFLEYRILKFNLPWSPYRNSEATRIHMSTCRDLRFWEQFLDMMVDNRFNVLSLWNNHPFPYMIRSASFPKASPLSDLELAEWKVFWKGLFAMASARGIQTFMVNWNIVVSPAFAEAYGAKEYNDLSSQVRQYTRESVRQLIDEYPNLTGLGVSLADWMGNFPDTLSAIQREEWIEQTFIAGMRDASRPVKFLHRSVLAGDPLAMRALLDRAALPDPALVEIKFNWSHGHSTPTLSITHDYHSGELDTRFWEPDPSNYKIQWMVRNEDFFILRWGQADFIRKHILGNKKSYVNGYFIGSEGYIPALDYAAKPGSPRDWQYAFQKQSLFYTLWGRLLYDPKTPDRVFEQALAAQFGNKVAQPLFEAYNLASKVPLYLASFYRSTWDYTLYSEGFIAAEPADPKSPYFDRSSPFISIREWMHHEVLDSSLCTIKEYVMRAGGKNTSLKISPLTLADSVERDCKDALLLIKQLERDSISQPSFLSTKEDLIVWSYLGLYFAEKIRAGVALMTYEIKGIDKEKEQAVNSLKTCLSYWDEIIAHTQNRYLAVPHVSTEHYGPEYQLFSWELMRPQVLKDIALAQETVYKDNAATL